MTGTRPLGDVAAEIRAIEELLTPWLRVESYGAQYIPGLRGEVLPSVAPYEFDTTVLPFGAPEGSPSALRAELLQRAEGALAALDEAGWQLTSYPAMEFTGELTSYFRQTLGGELAAPSAQGAIALRLRFSVNRPR